MRHTNQDAPGLLKFADQAGCALSNGQFRDSTDGVDFTAHEVPVEITKVLLKFSERFALSQVDGEFFNVAEPHLTVLPM